MATKKILVVEDNELNLKLFKDLIETKGYTVEHTKDGSEAFEMVKVQMPDLILMDIQLHGVSGFDVIKQIKSDPQIASIPIMAVTAFAMKDDKEKILEAGCESYISKPITIGSFLEEIERLLNKS